MSERKLNVDHITIWRWVQRYAPELNRRCRLEIGDTNRSWQVEETYCPVGGWQMDLFISGGRFQRRNNRFSPQREA